MLKEVLVPLSNFFRCVLLPKPTLFFQNNLDFHPSFALILSQVLNFQLVLSRPFLLPPHELIEASFADFAGFSKEFSTRQLLPISTVRTQIQQLLIIFVTPLFDIALFVSLLNLLR